MAEDLKKKQEQLKDEQLDEVAGGAPVYIKPDNIVTIEGTTPV